MEKTNSVLENKEMVIDLGIHRDIYWGYHHAKRNGNKVIDFNDLKWPDEVPQIVDQLRTLNIQEFTISSTWTSLMDVLAAFSMENVEMQGMTQILTGDTDFETGMPIYKNAILMRIAQEE